MHDRELSNSDKAGQQLPHEVHELAERAADDLMLLAQIAQQAPSDIYQQLARIGRTMQRLALYVEAVTDEGAECALRIAGRAHELEERLDERASAARNQMLALNVGEVMKHILRERTASPRPIGFHHPAPEGDGDGSSE